MKKKVQEVHPKLVASGLAGAVVTLLNGVLTATTGYDPSPAEVAAEVTIVSFLAGYLKA